MHTRWLMSATRRNQKPFCIGDQPSPNLHIGCLIYSPGYLMTRQSTAIFRTETCWQCSRLLKLPLSGIPVTAVNTFAVISETMNRRLNELRSLPAEDAALVFVWQTADETESGNKDQIVWKVWLSSAERIVQILGILLSPEVLWSQKDTQKAIVLHTMMEGMTPCSLNGWDESALQLGFYNNILNYYSALSVRLQVCARLSSPLC